MKQHWLKNQLVKGMKTQSFDLDPQGIFNFKLSDNSILIKQLQNEMRENFDMKNIVADYVNISDRLNETSLWLKLEDESLIKLSLKDLYLNFLKYLKDAKEADYLFHSYEVSFIGPLGPFQALSIVECINDNVLNRFLFDQILRNKLPARSMRLRTNQIVRATFGKEQKFKTELELCQVSDSGLLFRSQDDFFISNMESGNLLKFYMDTTPLEHLNFDSFKGQFNQLLYTRDNVKYFSIEQNKVIKSLSFKSAVDNHHHIFCRYQMMTEPEMANAFRGFTDKVKEVFKVAL